MWNRLLAIYQRFRHLILYACIGGFCAALDFGVYTALLCLPIQVAGGLYLWANLISTHVGIFCSFFLNRQYNFKVKDKTPIRFLSFYIVGLIGLGLSSLILYFCVTLAGWNELIIKLLSIIIVALTQFLLNKFITFKKS